MKATGNQYKSFDERPYESLYVYLDTVLDHPVEKVWPHVLNIGGWMSAHGLETLAGKPGTIGYFEKVLPRDLGQDVPLPHYHLYGIAEIVPMKLIVLEVYPEKGGSYGMTREFMSFDSILLTDMGNRTQVAVQLTDVHMGRGSAEYLEERKRDLAGSRELVQSYFGNLRRLVEEGG